MLLINICVIIGALLVPTPYRWIYSTCILFLCLYHLWHKHWCSLTFILISLLSLCFHGAWQFHNHSDSKVVARLNMAQACVALITPANIERILLRVDGRDHYLLPCSEEQSDSANANTAMKEVTLTRASLNGDWKARFAFAKGVDAMTYVFNPAFFDDTKKRSGLFDFPSWHLAYSVIKGQRIDWDQRERWLVNHLGITHLFVVSGLHVGFVALLALLLVRGLWHSSHYLRQCFGRRAYLEWLVAVPCCVAYAWWSGAGEPAQRAAFMAFLLFTSRALFHRQLLWTILLLSAWIMLLIWPGRLISPSFWLSFGFVGLLAVSVSKLPRRAKPIYLQCILSIFGLLFTLGWQQSLSISTVITNILLVPCVAFFWFPASLLGLLEYSLFSTTWLYSWIDSIVMFAYEWGAPPLLALPALNIAPVSNDMYKICLLMLAWVAILALPLWRAWLLLVLTAAASVTFYPAGSAKDERVWQRFQQTIIDASANDPQQWWPMGQTQLQSLNVAVNPPAHRLAYQALQQNWDIVLLNDERQEEPLLQGLGITVITFADYERITLQQIGGYWHVRSSNCYEFLNLVKTVACEHAESLESVLN